MLWRNGGASPNRGEPHLFSAPVGYLTRPYIVYRSRDVVPAKRGWERPGVPTGTRS